MNVRVLIGSKKGAFVLESDSERRDWRACVGLCARALAADPRRRRPRRSGPLTSATGGNTWFGPAVWKSNDGGSNMDPFEPGVGLPPRRARRYNAPGWPGHAAHGRLYVGVEPAGLFVSGDGGESFREVEGLRRHLLATSMATGRIFGPCAALHRFRSPTGRASPLGRHLFGRRVLHGGRRRKPGVRALRARAAIFCPRRERYPDFGQCVHNLTLAPGCSDRLYQQNHCGMRYRSDDGGASSGARHREPASRRALASSFVAAHPRDADTLFFPSRSTVTPRAAIRQRHAWPSGARAMAARIGLTVVRDCLSPAHISV